MEGSSMNETTALGLYRKALIANLQAEMQGIPAHQESQNGVMVTVAEYHQVRINNPQGELGPGVLKVFSDAGVSLASSDALLR